jgi:ankyrin repeat protein
MNIKDKDNNTPLHLAALAGHLDFIKDLKEKDFLIQPIEFYLNQINKQNISGFGMIREKDFIHNIIKPLNRKIHQHIPAVILELNKDTKDKKNVINLITKIILTEKLDASIMEHIDQNKIYLLIDISEQQFRIVAEIQQLKLKLLNKNIKKAFENKDEYIHSVEPVYSR